MSFSGRKSARRRGRHTRTWRVGFVAVLIVASAQVVWWIWDQSRYSQLILERTLILYQTETRAAYELLDAGRTPELVEELFPNLTIDAAELVDPDATEGVDLRGIQVSDEARAELVRERQSHLNQYRWEGSFFLLVLLAGMFILSRALREESDLRRRQQDFLAAVSHEFKSPLASLQLAADTMSRRSLSDEDRERWLGRVRGDLRRLGVMISNILDTARLEKGETVLSAESVALHPAVTRVISEVSDRATDLGVEVEPMPATSLRAQADPDALHTVMRNLIENAINAAAAAGGGTVSVAAEAEGRAVRLTVADDGIGFDPEETSKLFQRFYRVGDEMRRTSPGTGLGLAIVRRFVELEGGGVKGFSEGPGRGARFTVTWPRPEEDGDL